MTAKTRLQNICGYTFIVLFVLQFIVQTLLLSNTISQQTSWYAYVIGACAITAFALLTRLSSNYISRIFALCLLSLEVFFTVGRPFMLAIAMSDKHEYPVIFWACLGFNVLALYFWSLLFTNCKFDRRYFFFLLLLPLPYIVNIMSYGGFICYFYNLNTIASWAVQNMQYVTLIRMFLALLLPYGYWILSHSSNFSGYNTDKYSKVHLWPFNRYFLVYLLIAAILLAAPL